VRKMNTPGDEVLALEGAPPGMQPEQQDWKRWARKNLLE